MPVEYIGVIAGHSGDSLTDKLHEKGYKAALIAGREGEPGTDTADSVLIGDISDSERVIDFFKGKNVNKVIIGTGHKIVFNTAKILNDNGFNLSIDIEKSLLAKDKIAFKKVLEDIGILTPKYMEIKTKDQFDTQKIIDEIDLPCVVKSSTDGVQPRKVHTKNELTEAASDVFDTNTVLLIEEFIDGGDCTVAVCNDSKDIFAPTGITYWCKAKEYKLKGFENSAKPAELTPKQKKEIIDKAVKIIEKTGILGLARIDFIVNDKIYVLETNSVIVTGYNGSSYPFFKRDGYDIAEIMVDNSLRLFENLKHS